jgi:16S rRNA G1207 methylase RsmC
VNIHEAKTTLSKLIERVEQGEEIVIAATASRSRDRTLDAFDMAIMRAGGRAARGAPPS